LFQGGVQSSGEKKAQKIRITQQPQSMIKVTKVREPKTVKIVKKRKFKKEKKNNA